MDRTNTIGWTGRAVCAGAALLMVAGTAAAQQGGYGPPGRPMRGDQPTERMTPPGQTVRQGGARAMRDQPIFLRSQGGENEVLVRIYQGQAAAKIDGELVPQEQVQVRGNRIYVLDDFGDMAAVFRVPASVLRQTRTDEAGWDQFFEEEGRQTTQPPRQQQQRRPGQGTDTARFFIPEPWAEHAWLLEQPKVVLGILMEPVGANELREHEEFTRGVRVERVHEGLAAAESGIKSGDIIVAIDGEANVTSDEIRQFIRDANPGDTVELTVIRNGQEQNVEVELKEFEPSELNWDFMAPGPQEDQPGRDWQDRERPRQQGEQRRPGGETGGDTPPRLGISISEAPSEMFEDVEGHSEGVLVQSVQDDLPAAKAGLEQGDIIVEFNGQAVGTPEELQEQVNQARTGQTVRLTIIRDGETRNLSVNLTQ